MKKISRRSFFRSASTLTLMPFLATAQETQTQQNLKFVHITDSHMDLSIEDSVEALELMVEMLNKDYKDLDFVVFGGDNFNNNVNGNADALAFKKIVDKLHCPTYHVRGNKEANPKPNDAIALDEFKTLFMSSKALKVQNKDWLLNIKGYAFLGLDSCIEGANNGLYTEETLAFAESVLKQGKPTIILNHHPYTNYWKSTDAKDIHKYVLNNTQETQKRLFTFDNFILSLSGHKHIDSVSLIHKTKAIVTRGFIRPLDMDMYPMRYIELKGKEISEKLIYTA